MSEAPERVWLTHPWQMSLVSKKRTVEYVRADKLEELAAENDRLLKSLDDNWVQHQRVAQAETDLAEAKRENEALREALEQARIAMDGYGWKLDCVEKALARNAGGNDAE